MSKWSRSASERDPPSTDYPRTQGRRSRRANLVLPKYRRPQTGKALWIAYLRRAYGFSAGISPCCDSNDDSLFVKAPDSPDLEKDLLYVPVFSLLIS